MERCDARGATSAPLALAHRARRFPRSALSLTSLFFVCLFVFSKSVA